MAILVAMNSYAVDVRYADDWEPRRDDAVQALAIAESVCAEVRRLLSNVV